MADPERHPDSGESAPDSSAPHSYDALEWTRFLWERNFDIPPDDFIAMSAVLRTSQILVEHIEIKLAEYSLTRTSYMFLMTLYLSEDRARHLSRIGEYLIVHPATITLLVDALEPRKLVVRRPHPTDRRATLCVLTATGSLLVEKVTQELAATRFGFSGASDGDVETIYALMQKVAADLPPPAKSGRRGRSTISGTKGSRGAG